MMMQSVAGGGLVVGDVVGACAARPDLVQGGPANWYALRVAPQREDQAEAWLRLRGVYGFHPVLQRKVHRFGKVRSYQRRYLPGYVFARFHGVPLVHEVLACPFILGALCHSSGVWGVLERSKLSAIHAMRSVDAQAKDARRADALRRRQAAALRQGDAVIFRDGPFEEVRGEVVALQADGGVTVRLVLFGREVDVGAPVGDVVALRIAS